MSDLLSIGASGVRAYQTALSVVGENIANVGVVGYSRRTTALQEMSAGVGATDKQSGGNGVLMANIGRASDDYAASSLRNAGADLARTETSATWLGKIEQALTGNALGTRVTGFFNAATALAAEPTSAALRTGLIGAAQSATVAFKATGQAVDQLAADINLAARQSTETLNSLSASLVRVNDGLGRTTPGTGAAAQLADQRDQILEQMSAITDIGVTTDALGRATVAVGGVGGTPLVRGEYAATVSAVPGGGGMTFAITVQGSTTTTPLSPNGGALAGITEAAERVTGTRGVLNAVATDFVKRVNDVQKAGDDLAGDDGTDLLQAPAGDPTDMSLNWTDGKLIAAAQRDKGPRNGSNLTGFEEARFSGAFEAKLTALTNESATAYKQKSVIAEAQTAIRAGASTALSSATGVNIDAEAVDLMRFQQAYQASSRVIQVARDTFQSILEIR